MGHIDNFTEKRAEQTLPLFFSLQNADQKQGAKRKKTCIQGNSVT